MECLGSFGVSIMLSAVLHLLQQQETLGIKMHNMKVVVKRGYEEVSLEEACTKEKEVIKGNGNKWKIDV